MSIKNTDETIKESLEKMRNKVIRGTTGNSSMSIVVRCTRCHAIIEPDPNHPVKTQCRKFCDDCEVAFNDFMSNPSELPQIVIIGISLFAMFFLGAYGVLSTASYWFTTSNYDFIHEFGYTYDVLGFFGFWAIALSVLLSVLISYVTYNTQKKELIT